MQFLPHKLNLSIAFIHCPLPSPYVFPSHSFSSVVFLFLLSVFPSPFAYRVLVTIFTWDRIWHGPRTNGRLPKDIKCKFFTCTRISRLCCFTPAIPAIGRFPKLLPKANLWFVVNMMQNISTHSTPFISQNNVKTLNWRCCQVRYKKNRAIARKLRDAACFPTPMSLWLLFAAAYESQGRYSTALALRYGNHLSTKSRLNVKLKINK